MNQITAAQAVGRELNQMEPEMQISGGEPSIAGMTGEKVAEVRDRLLAQVRVLESELRRTLDTPDFPSEVKKKFYRQKEPEAHQEVFKYHDLTMDDAKQVNFSFVTRFREYFQKCYEPTLEDDFDLEAY